MTSNINYNYYFIFKIREFKRFSFETYKSKIITNSVITNSFEGVFDITESGTYTLLIETSTDEVVNVVGGIGHMPDASVYSISMAGFVLLLIGMIGVVVVGIILVRARKKAGTN